MKTTKKYLTCIGEITYEVNDTKTHVLYGGEWQKLEEDELGDKYFQFRGKIRWIGFIGTN